MSYVTPRTQPQIPVRKIDLLNGYLLEFVVTDPYEITALLLTAKDPTLVNNPSTTIASQNFIRHANVDEESGDVIEESIELIPEFVRRSYIEALDWAAEEIATHKEIQEVADAFSTLLNETVGPA